MTESSDKAIGLFKLQLNSLMQPFMGYGLQIFIPETIEHIIAAALELHNRLNNNWDTKPLQLNIRERPTEDGRDKL